MNVVAGPVRRIVNSFLDRLSELLLVFGALLLVVGIAVQIVRHVQLSRALSHAAPPPVAGPLGPTREAVRGRQVAPVLPPEDDAAPGVGATGQLAAPATSTPAPTGLPPVRFVAPTIKIDTPVVEVGWDARVVNGENAGNEWVTADYAAGHHQLSSRPGEVGNMVLSGHNNIKGSVFRDLYLLELGDPLYVYDAAGRRFAYEVAESFVVPEAEATPKERMDNTHWIRQSADERLTLVTCFPPWSNTHRWIVLAVPVPGEPAGTTTAPRVTAD